MVMVFLCVCACDDVLVCACDVDGVHVVVMVYFCVLVCDGV